MLKKEFEDRIGRTATDEEYNEANAIYEALPQDMDKDRFCKMYLTKDGRLDMCTMLAATVYNLRNDKREWTEERRSIGMTILESVYCSDVTTSPIDDCARRLLGDTEYLKRKLEAGYFLTKEDRELLIGML